MFKRGITILLITCILGANFSSLFVVAGFEMNKKYISTTLCENKDKPWLHCNGHCYLMKKIKQAEQKAQNEERETQKNLIQQVFHSSVNGVVFSSVLLQIFPDPYREMSPQSASHSLLRPPRFA